ncbi:MAG: 2-hydroxyacyl-CoA dehydratase [Dehalococcoidia bacterium]
MIEPFVQAVNGRHDYARQWKARTGGRVVGYLCTYVPEELLYAAGMLPVRVLGSHQPQDVTEPHIFSIFCPFCRDVLAQGLQGRYSYLDGLVKARSCMHIRNTFTSWQKHIPLPFSYYIGMPAIPQLGAARDFLVGELGAFKEALEGWTGQPITEAALSEAVEVYNANRCLMRQLYQTRRAERPPISGEEAMYVALASQVMDKREHSALLSDLLSGLDSRPDPPQPGVRLMLVGTENDDADLVALMESKGGLVVADDHCSGSRYFWNDVAPDGDLLRAIATRYIERPRCPAKDIPQRQRLEHVVGIARDYDVQGVVLLQQKFCEPFEYEIPPLQARLREEGIPSLFLEYDLAMNVGPMSSRIEAFLEMIELEI